MILGMTQSVKGKLRQDRKLEASSNILATFNTTGFTKNKKTGESL